MRVRSGAHRCTSRWSGLGLLALAASGCTTPFGESRTADSASTAAAGVAAPADPVAAFAATAAPGSETVAVLPETGGSARLRLLRSYNAASGRECREVLIGTGLAERTRLVCRHEGGWAAARPLLSGSGARP
jgi:17 kDa common-antigen outer membrane protein